MGLARMYRWFDSELLEIASAEFLNLCFQPKLPMIVLINSTVTLIKFEFFFLLFGYDLVKLHNNISSSPPFANRGHKKESLLRET